MGGLLAGMDRILAGVCGGLYLRALRGQLHRQIDLAARGEGDFPPSGSQAGLPAGKAGYRFTVFGSQDRVFARGGRILST